MSLPLSGKGLAGMAATIGVIAAGLTAAIGRKRIAKALGEPARKSGSRKKPGKSKS